MALIRITLRSDLCAGSGEATGVAVDKDLCISQAGLPYIPARRIKGCLRQAAMTLQTYGCPEAGSDAIDALFGNKLGVEGCLVLRDAVLPGAEAMERWLSGKQVPRVLQKGAKPLNVAKLFTYVRGQTSLEDGIAAEGTLRYTRVLERFNALDPKHETCLEAPVFFRGLNGETAASETLAALLGKCCQALRQMGTMRNRGLGSVKVELIDPKTLTNSGQLPALSQGKGAAAGTRAEIRFRVALEAPVTLPGCQEELLEIPARSVIGCASAAYLRTGKAEDPLFRELFLNGSVQWSALTPSFAGKRSLPAPLMLVQRKEQNDYINRCVEAPGKSKLKTVEGAYAAETEEGFQIVKVRSHSLYHHSTGTDATLYLQSSLDAGMIYAGTVSVPAGLEQTVIDLLRRTEFAFGRSRSAQYAVCSLQDVSGPVKPLSGNRFAAAGEPVYVVLQSDLLLSEGGLYRCDNEFVRAFLAEKLGLENRLPDGCIDYCQYHIVGGYHLQWQLQKPQLQTVRGGSVYVFLGKGNQVPTEARFGELLQEGFGLCRIYTSEEMRRLKTVSEGSVDQKPLSKADETWCARLKSALLIQTGRETIRAFIRGYYADHEVNGIRSGMIGRLRLMLFEASDYADLTSRVNTIKESDVNSSNTKSDREKILELLDSIYGANRQKPSFAVMLKAAPGLFDAIRADNAAASKLDETWKEPLEVLVHLAYYGKDRGERS